MIDSTVGHTSEVGCTYAQCNSEETGGKKGEKRMGEEGRLSGYQMPSEPLLFPVRYDHSFPISGTQISVTKRITLAAHVFCAFYSVLLKMTVTLLFSKQQLYSLYWV